MAETGLARMKESDSIRRLQLENLKRHAIAQIIRTMGELRPTDNRCHFNKLPVEICSEIFVLVADSSIKKAIVLSSVCKHWRATIVSTPSLWRHLHLSYKTRSKMVDILLKRSNGIIHTLRIRQGFSFDARPNILRFASENIWYKLESLEIVISAPMKTLSDILPSGVFPQLRVQTLDINFVNPVSNSNGSLLKFWEPLQHLDVSSLRSISFVQALLIPWGSLTRCHSLRHLKFHSKPFTFSELFDVIQLNSSLETLVVIHTYDPSDILESRTINKKIDLNRLRLLEIVGTFDSLYLYFQYINFPNLEVLRIASAEMHSSHYLDMLCEQSMSRLSELLLRQCIVDLRSVTNLLWKASKLKKFTYMGCHGASADSIMSILSNSEPDSVASPPGPVNIHIPCPLLYHVDFSDNAELHAGPVVRLVQARLPGKLHEKGPAIQPGPSSPVANVPPVPIRNLILDNCDSIDAEVFPWLESRVGRLSSMAKRRWTQYKDTLV